jgi:hypothetical protein
MGHLLLVTQHLGLTMWRMVFYRADLYQLWMVLQTMLLKCLNWWRLLQEGVLACC